MKCARLGSRAVAQNPGGRGSHTTARELQTCTFHGPGASNTTKIPRKDPKREKEERKLWREKGKKREILGLPPFGATPFGPPFGAPPFGAPLGLHPSGPPPFEASTLRGLHPSGLPPFGASTLRGFHPSGPQPSGPNLRDPTFSGFGPPPFGATTLRGHHPSGPPPFGAHLSGPHFFWVWASTLGASTLWGPPKIQHPKIGRSRNWPKSKLAEVEIGRNRNWPKSKLAEVELAELEKKAGRSRNWPKSIALGNGGVGRVICSGPRRPSLARRRDGNINHLVSVLYLGRLDDRLCQGDSRSCGDLLDDVLQHAILRKAVWWNDLECLDQLYPHIWNLHIKNLLSKARRPHCCSRSNVEEAGHESRSSTSRKPQEARHLESRSTSTRPLEDRPSAVGHWRRQPASGCEIPMPTPVAREMWVGCPSTTQRLNSACHDVVPTLHERVQVRAGNPEVYTRLTSNARQRNMDPAFTHACGTNTGIPGPVSGPCNDPSRLRTQGLPPRDRGRPGHRGAAWRQLRQVTRPLEQVPHR